MNSNRSESYGPVVKELLAEQRLMPLGPGKPNAAMRSKFGALTPDEIFAGQIIRDKSMAEACLAGLWLYHDYLDESHTISQSIKSNSGGYWHGIMHRREPDFSNAKYWFRRVGEHPVFKPLRAAAQTLARSEKPQAPAEYLITQTAWDPFAFVDLCEACVAGSAPYEFLCQQIQQREWELLFDYCYIEALGARNPA